MSEPGQFAFFLALGLASLGLFFGPLAGAIARRIERGKGGISPEALEQLEARLAALEQDRERMTELEERLDFAERVLSQQRSVEQIGE